MPNDPRIAVKFMALDCAMLARIDALTGEDVDRLRETAERNIPDQDDTLRRAVIGFVTQYEIHRHDADELEKMGTALRDFIDTDNVPVPPDAGRADIYG